MPVTPAQLKNGPDGVSSLGTDQYVLKDILNPKPAAFTGLHTNNPTGSAAFGYDARSFVPPEGWIQTVDPGTGRVGYIDPNWQNTSRFGIHDAAHEAYFGDVPRDGGTTLDFGEAIGAAGAVGLGYGFGGAALEGLGGETAGAGGLGAEEAFPVASQADVAGFGLGGAEYGGYAPTSYASSVGGATGGGGFSFQNMLKNALQQQGNAAGSADPGMRQKLTHLLAPASLNPVAGAEQGGQGQPADPYAPQQYGAYGAPYMQALKRQMLAKSLAGESEYGEL